MRTTEHGRRADCRKHAEVAEEERLAKELARPKATRPWRPRKRNPNRRIELMKILRREGPTSAKELAEPFSISVVMISNYMVELEKLGLVERTEANPRSSKQKYRLTSAGVTALENEDDLRRQLERPVSEAA